MPVTVTVDPARRLPITTGEGVITDEELLRAREQLLANPDFDPAFDRIWDFHATTEAQMSEAVVAGSRTCRIRINRSVRHRGAKRSGSRKA